MFNHWCYIIRQLLTNPSWLTLIWWLPLVPDKNNADFKVNSCIKLLIGITSATLELSGQHNGLEIFFDSLATAWQWFYGRKLDASKVVDSLMTSGQNFWTTWQQLTTGDNGDLEYAYRVVLQSPLCLGKCFIGIRCWKIWEVFFELPSSYGLIIFVYFHIIMIMVLWYRYWYLEVLKVKSLLGAEHHMAWCNSKSARVWIFIGLAYKLVTGNHQQIIITIIHQQHHLNIWKDSWDPPWATKKCNKRWALS